jgi:putative ABC transport system substrate-binding protein
VSQFIKRRSFLTLLGGAAAAWPLAARAQQSAMPVIGFLGAESPDLFAACLRAFHQGLRETGFVEGRNVAVEYRWAEGQNNRLPALATELARRQVNVIVAGGTPAALAAKAASTTVPVVFLVGIDPVDAGLVASLSRPGGNLTGFSLLTSEVTQKRIELLHELLPQATKVAVLINPSTPNADTQTKDLQAAAHIFGLELQVAYARTESEFEAAFATISRAQVGGLVIGDALYFSARPQQLAALALRYKVPSVSQYREFAAAGGLMTYGSDLTNGFHSLGVYAARILKGEKSADLPVQQATRIELVINMKTAKALGLTFPLTLLGRADEVIE